MDGGDRAPRRSRWGFAVSDAGRAVADVGALVRFRASSLSARGRRAAVVALAIALGGTVSAAVVPALVGGMSSSSSAAQDVLLLLPTAYAGFLVVTTFAIVGAGGGRELLPREQAVAFPVSPTTDHLGALLLAPLNIAWILQTWTVLGATAYVVGARWTLWAVQLTTFCWLLAATAGAQVVAWCVEWVRRGPHGIIVVRALGVVVFGVAAALVATHHVGPVLDRVPTLRVVLLAFQPVGGRWGPWVGGLLLLVAGGLAALGLGAAVAHAVAHRPARDEQRGESRTMAARPMPRTRYGALLRTDRNSVWRSVPLRRGFLVLALLPGLVAAAGHLDWQTLPVLPGLVAAGGALLLGVNAWCLDGTGTLWRDSLPVKPRTAYVVRVQILLEMLVLATVLCLLVASLRASGRLTGTEVAAMGATAVVVPLQVAARSMTWSVRRPFSMDLRSTRGAPAPPFAMVGYSSYLAMTCTFTGLVFSATARSTDPWLTPLIAVPLILLAVRRLVATSRLWADPEVRSNVVATVSTR